MLKKYDIMNSAVQENLVAVRVVKAFVRSKYEKEKFEDATDKLRYAQLRAEKVVIFNMPIMQFTMYGCMIAIVWFGGNMIIGGSMMTGELMSFISYVTQILMSLMMISMVFISTVLSKASVTRIIEVMDEKVDILDSDLSTEIIVEDGSVIFENVSFSYSKNKENLTVSNINFKINSGETIGIIGGTGSSKSSLVQLIPRLYDVMDGKIIVGKHDVRDYKLETLRDSVAMVLTKKCFIFRNN